MDINEAKFAGGDSIFYYTQEIAGKKTDSLSDTTAIFKAEIKGVSSVLKAIEQLARV